MKANYFQRSCQFACRIKSTEKLMAQMGLRQSNYERGQRKRLVHIYLLLPHELMQYRWPGRNTQRLHGTETDCWVVALLAFLSAWSSLGSLNSCHPQSGTPLTLWGLTTSWQMNSTDSKNQQWAICLGFKYLGVITGQQFLSKECQSMLYSWDSSTREGQEAKIMRCLTQQHTEGYYCITQS